jgi:hypothetical protein
MLTKRFALIGLIACMFMLVGCSGTVPAHKETLLERNWGRSFESAKYHQMLNPEAGKDPDPVVGLDGTAAEKNLEKYRQTDIKKDSSKEFGIISVKSK